MKTLLLSPWSAVLTCAALSTLVDTLGTLWWEQKKNWILLAILGISPLVFLAFGYVGFRFGLAKASSLTNTLVVMGRSSSASLPGENCDNCPSLNSSAWLWGWPELSS